MTRKRANCRGRVGFSRQKRRFDITNCYNKMNFPSAILFQYFLPQRTQRSQRSWDGEKGERSAPCGTTLATAFGSDLRSVDTLRGSRFALRQPDACRRGRMASSRLTKTPASQATRIPRQICRVFEAKKTGDLGLGIWYNTHCQNGNVTGLIAPRREPPRRGRQDRRF